jgi:Bacterial protein of unknown function (DUF899)
VTDETARPDAPADHTGWEAVLPPIVDRAAFQAELDKLRVREKAHTRPGDAIAAARRRQLSRPETPENGLLPEPREDSRILLALRRTAAVEMILG